MAYSRQMHLSSYTKQKNGKIINLQNLESIEGSFIYKVNRKKKFTET